MNGKLQCFICTKITLFTIALITLAMPILSGGCDAPGTTHLLPAEPDAVTWYKRYREYSRWNPRPTRPVKEVTPLNYDFPKLVKRIFREEILAENWQDNILRKADWIHPPRSRFWVRKDAYVYRQETPQGLLHICDTRNELVAIFIPKEPFDVSDPDKASKEIIPKFLKFSKLPKDCKTLLTDFMNETPFKKKLKLYGGMIGIATGAPKNEHIASGPECVSGNEPYHTCFFKFGEKLLIVSVQKGGVMPGYVFDSRYPFFESANKKPCKADICLKEAEKIAGKEPKDIPQLVKLLKKTPNLYSELRASFHPFEADKISDTKWHIFTKLKTCVKAIDPKDKNALTYVKQALKARKYIRDLHRAAKESYTLQLDDIIFQIHTKEAMKLRHYLIKTESDKSTLAHLTKEQHPFEKYPDLSR